jgi:energy-coupling factor transport system permease protein
LSEEVSSRKIVRAWEYVEAESFLHRLHPLSKFMMIFTVTAIVITFLDPIFGFLLALTLWIIAWRSGVSSSLVMVFKGAVAIMGVLFASLYFIMYTAYPLVMFGEFKIIGFVWAASALYRYCNLVGIVGLFAATTRIIDLANSMVNLKVPPRLASTISISFATITLFISEMRNIIDAYKSRGYSISRFNLFSRLRSYFELFPPAMFATIRRSRIMALTLEMKGFTYPVEKTFRVVPVLKRVDKVVIGLNVLVIVLCGVIPLLVNMSKFPYTLPLFQSLYEESLLYLVFVFFLYILFPLLIIFKRA